MNNTLPRKPVFIMLATFAGGVLLHVDRLHFWCSAVALGAVAWHWLHCLNRVRLPGATLRLGVALTLLAAVAASFRTLGGLSAGSSLLLVMGAAKLLETRTQRDALVVAMVSLVLVLAACLDRQTLLRVPAYLVTSWMALATITAMCATAEAASIRRAFRTAGRALLLALPLAALCFVFVPRMPGALWSMPGGGSARTGLSDEMSPGSITELAIFDEVAFRVRFDGPAPPMSQRYWRGPVLHDFDGFTWRRLRGQAIAQEPTPLSAPVRYRVLLEPNGSNYLPGLDVISSIEGRRNVRAFDGQVLSPRPVTSVLAYEGVSHLRTRYTGKLSRTGRSLDTRLPVDRNLRTLALARELRASVATDSQYTERVLTYFREAGFEYTLTPPPLGRHSVDDLVFTTRRGFCGHFASAYVTMMRAAGVPARVVTGYLGGAWNPVGGFHTVRQSDAHAWAEVWIDGNGWTRIDPTAVVAPGRLERGLEAMLAGETAGEWEMIDSNSWLQNWHYSWDAIDSWWQERIVNFNRGAQLDLLRRLGLERIDYAGMVMLLAAGTALWGLALWLFNARRLRQPHADALGSAWQDFIALLEKNGLPVAAHEGPRSIAIRAGQHLPTLAGKINGFAGCYEQLRFGRGPADPAAIRALRAQLRWIRRATAAARPTQTAATRRE